MHCFKGKQQWQISELNSQCLSDVAKVTQQFEIEQAETVCSGIRFIVTVNSARLFVIIVVVIYYFVYIQ